MTLWHWLQSENPEDEESIPAAQLFEEPQRSPVSGGHW